MSDTGIKLLVFLPVVLISMTLHEMMHALASYKLGDDTAYLQGRVSFNPLRHIDPFLTIALPMLLLLLGGVPFGAAKPVQVNFYRLKFAEFGGAIVGVIGPLTNFGLAVVSAAVLRSWQPESNLLFNFLAYMVIVNIGFFIFNMVPWPPLDGSRLLYAFAPRFLQEKMESVERFGINGLLIYMVVFLTFLAGPLAYLIVRLSSFLTAGIVS